MNNQVTPFISHTALPELHANFILDSKNPLTKNDETARNTLRNISTLQRDAINIVINDGMAQIKVYGFASLSATNAAFRDLGAIDTQHLPKDGDVMESLETEETTTEILTVDISDEDPDLQAVA